MECHDVKKNRGGFFVLLLVENAAAAFDHCGFVTINNNNVSFDHFFPFQYDCKRTLVLLSHRLHTRYD